MSSDNEIWRVVPWSNGLYYASNLGRIKRIEGVVRNRPSNIDGYRKTGGKILKQKTKRNGYMEVNMYIEPQKSKMCYVHRAVYFSFNPTADFSLQINHINLDKSDNALINLDLVTPSENIKHAYENGKINLPKGRLGESATNVKLSKNDVISIREIYKQTKAVTRIAKLFNISKTQVQRIVKRKSWSHI